ncbi:MAG: DNA cytosine methyltransferase [Clostridium sp.]|uniref:DNA cytosine methyltransferase n=1 Tax=Clostridium sp. TaxID=1506 RepID=UPI0025C48467|nr:DNA cytosine methyltransferase [Clostridium sp.]MCE5220606.1 DNA cytosine methyltransferase [Clostridium sp.]
MPYAIDLFCGAGGMSEGIIQAGFHILFSSDINEDVERTYKNRHEQLGYIQGYNTFFRRTDIRELDGHIIWESINSLTFFNEENQRPEEIDAIFGGPPCQGFSRAGRRDPNDPRNMLFREYLRVIRDINPRYVVMENVEGFNDTRFDGFQSFDGEIYEDNTLVREILINEFNKLHYNVLEPRVLDASDYGVPQRRRRAIFIAYRNGENIPRYPEPTHIGDDKLTVLDAISDLIKDDNIRRAVSTNLTQYQIESRQGRTPTVQGNIPLGDRALTNIEISRHSPIIVERSSLYNEGEDSAALKRRIISNGIDIRGKVSLINECTEKLNINEEELIRRFGNADVTEEMIRVLLTKKSIRTRLSRNRPSNTVVTLPDDYISPFENRMFSVREMARLQSFDDNFEFLGKRTTGGQRRRSEVPQYSQVGNAVPPLLARAVANEIMRALM